MASMLIRSAAIMVAAIAVTHAPVIAQDFIQTAGPTGGNVMSLTMDANTAWATTSTGSIFRSDDAGATWSRIETAGLPANAFLEQIVNLNGPAMLVRERINVYRSQDDGVTWSPIDVDLTNTVSSRLTVDGPAVVLLLDGNPDRLYTTHDDGVTWSPVDLPLADVGDVFFKDDVLLVSGGSFSGALFRTLTLGPPWQSVGDNLPNDLYARFATGQPALVLQCIFSGRFFHSPDIGLTWNEIFPPFAGGFFLQPIGVADGHTNMFAVFAEQNLPVVYESTDDGLTWQSTGAAGLPKEQVSSSLPMPIASAFGGPLLIGYGYSGLGVYRSTDGGTQWNVANDGLIATRIDTVGAVGANLLASAVFFDDNYRSTDDGESWSEEPALPDIATYLALDDTTVLAGSRGSGAFRSDDAGLTWSAVNTGLPDYVAMDGGTIEPINDLEMHGGMLFAATGGGREFVGGDDHCGCTGVASGDGVYRTSNGGASWQRVSNGLPINTFVLGEPILRPILALQSVNGALLAATPEHGVFRSTNDGGNWSLTSGAPGGADFALFNGDVYLADGAGGLHRSTNAGQSWSMVSTDLPADFAFARLHVHDNTLYAASGDSTFNPGDGIYSSINGSNWQSASTSLADEPVTSLVSKGDDLFVGTIGRGVWVMEGAPAVPADINGDGAVDVFDLLDLLANWGTNGPGSDIAEPDDVVDVFDLLELLAAWG